MRGRKSKPTKLKILHGVENKKRINFDEPPVAEGEPDCPPHLDEEARVEWVRICADLAGMSLLSPAHRPALAAYCTAWSRWVAAEEKVQKHGIMLIRKDGERPYPSPFVGVANRAMEEMRKWLVEFGLTPSSLTRVRATHAATSGTAQKYFGAS